MLWLLVSRLDELEYFLQAISEDLLVVVDLSRRMMALELLAAISKGCSQVG